MKKALGALMFGCLLAVAPATTMAQDTAAIEYYEQVTDPEPDRKALYHRALDWTEHHFSYAPKIDLRADSSKGELRVTGSGKVKTVQNSGKLQEQPVRFEFVFHAVPTGYEYRVSSFRLITSAEKPEEGLDFTEYVMQLAAERTNERTHNDRRVTAQANSLASEVALSFRSYMNSRPAAGMVE